MVRVMLIDAENMLGARARDAAVRAGVAALRAAAGPVDHAVAAYSAAAAVEDVDGLDVTASVLAEDGVGVLRVDSSAQAADRALIAHARRVASDASVQFVIASADGRFAELAELGPVEVTAWEGQPVAGRLAAAAARVVRVVRPARALRTATGSAEPSVDATTGVGSETEETSWLTAVDDSCSNDVMDQRQRSTGWSWLEGHPDLDRLRAWSSDVDDGLAGAWLDRDMVAGVLAAAAAGAALGATRSLAEAVIDAVRRRRSSPRPW